MNFLTKKASQLKKPKVIIVTGTGGSEACDFILRAIGKKVPAKNMSGLPNIFDILNFDILILSIDTKNQKDLKELKELAAGCSLVILLATNTSPIIDGQEFSFDEAGADDVRKLAAEMPSNCYFVFNSDDKALQKLDKLSCFKSFKFGFSDASDFKASDVSMADQITNFKLNYKGSIIPFWLKKESGKEEKGRICSTLSAICVGTILGLNIVEIAENLKG